MKNVMLSLIKNIKTKYGIHVWYAHCNNAGEKNDFECICKQEGMGIEFENTSPSTPLQNDCVEWKFIILSNRVCVMLNGGKFLFFLRNNLWTESANTATLLGNNLVTPNRGLNPFQQFLGRDKEASFLWLKNLVKLHHHILR